ncbi:MAG TPA: class I SAM-dependent methyltransferase [Myxococcota bacterium]|nr:class I SAM-dependent methyltransferase [Myxococcota bacterium]
MSTYQDDFYRDPTLYDLEYMNLVEDLEHYRRLALAAGAVLELGCGTGRVTLPMARTGARVVGVDLSVPMLECLEQKLEADLDVRLVHADFRHLDLGQTFPLIVLPFNAFHHLYTADEVLDFFERLEAHLEPEGRFALDLLVPDFRFFERDPDGVYEVRRRPDPDGGMMKSWENGWYDTIAQVNHVRYHYERADGRRQLIEVPMRMWYPQEILGLLRLGRWTLLRCDQDFKGTPLGPKAMKMVLVLRPRKGRGRASS